MNHKTVSRNDPCPCGSGKKYKQCCQSRESANSPAAKARLLENVPELFKKAYTTFTEGDATKAEELYLEILAINPKHIDSLHNIGVIALSSHRPQMAIEYLRKAVKLNPSAIFFHHLAIAYSNVHQQDEAVACLYKSIELNPAYAEGYNDLGLAMRATHRYNEAIEFFSKAISIAPNNDTFIGNLACCYNDIGDDKLAIEWFSKAIAINPNLPTHHQNLLLALSYSDAQFPIHYLKAAHDFDKALQKQTTPYQNWLCSPVTCDSPLRIGLVSGDFYNHPVGHFLESFLTHLNHNNIQAVAYTSNYFQHDDLTARIKPHFHQWHDISSLNNKQAAAKVHEDGIHILIDLSGHSANNRLALFAYKPAPIQLSWLGFFASTGLSCMDYFVSDTLSSPPETLSHFTEKVWLLPETRLCFSAPAAHVTQEVSPLPALRNGYITFGCFQVFSKINDDVLSLWIKILQHTPHSKILFKNHQIKDEKVKLSFLRSFKKHNISLERIILEEGGSRSNYLSAYAQVDFMLDTFPYPGGTTTCEALWMGVPTLTLTGNTLLKKQGQSILTTTGLENWVADSEDQYLEKAISMTNDISYLASLRHRLRAQTQNSPLMNAPRFAHHFENMLYEMWRQYIDIAK
ncbi:MAG: tetratricopeptide repeat protein [Agitococcus sp.]|nr:tetratricopeptide repeat protein [Agitococcus sp.]